MGMRIGWCGAAAVLSVAASGCGGRVVVDHLQPGEWAATDASPIAAVGPAVGVGDVPGGVVVARLGPFATRTVLDRVEIGQAPGWGCATPATLPIAIWASASLEPEGDPADELQLVTTKGALAEDIGNGFEVLTLDLDERVEVPAGEVAFVGFAHATATTCGAGTMGPSAAWRWRPGVGWLALTSGLVVGASGLSDPLW